MNSAEKAIARKLFKLKIHESNGQMFENLFTQIMYYSEDDFQQIKPWGQYGDRKNDGYVASKGIYYQVYAPEDPETRKSYENSIKKLETDLEGLLSEWNPVKEFYFLVNDKYLGVNPEAEKRMNELKKKHNLENGKIMTAKDLEKIVFDMDDDQIITITGHLPDAKTVTNLDFEVVNEVVGHILKLPIKPRSGEIRFPDWSEKIVFNEISPLVRNSLEFASQNLGPLDKFLSNQPFLAENLQKKLTGLYREAKANIINHNDPYPGDFIFWEMVKKSSPLNENIYESAVITVLAKYFESCDIFEEPPNR